MTLLMVGFTLFLFRARDTPFTQLIPVRVPARQSWHGSRRRGRGIFDPKAPVMAWTVRSEGSGCMVADDAEVRRAISIFADPRYGFELVALPSSRHICLPASDTEGILKAAREMPGGMGIYFHFNPLPVGNPERVKKDAILYRRWIYIDVDPVKSEPDNPATDEEKNRTASVCDSVFEYLHELGWPAPVICDSGNGFAMYYRCELPNDALIQTIYKQFLVKLADKFNGANGVIDKSIHNANRIVKLPGTWAKKGLQSDDRPFRICKLLSVPSEIEPVSFELFRDSVGEISEQKPVPAPTPSLNGHHKATRSGAYGRKALDNECTRVVLAKAHGEGRNNALNAAAFSLGQLVAGGVLIRGEVEDRLFEAACASGLDTDPNCGERGIKATIQSGLTAGMGKPRSVPEQKPDPVAVMNGRVKNEPKADGSPLTVNLQKVKPLQVEWLVRNRIPMRFITVFAGRTGVGKSFVSHDLIARLSTGGEIPFSGGECFQPSGTLILSEDSHEYVLVPRLMEAGADLSKIHALTWESMSSFHLGDTDMLTRACEEVTCGVKLVMIDPPTNFLADTDEHSNSEVRQLVMRVVEWALGRDIAVLFILHVNKQSGKGVEALNRVMGSVAWVTTARIAHTFTVDPDNSDRCLWVPLKNNLGELGKAVAYRINKTDKLARVEWLEEVDTTADEALGHSPRQRRDVAASEWLIERFREKLEWPSDELFRTAREHNVSKDAIFEAKKLLNLPKAKKRTCENGDTSWVWWVPDDWDQLSQVS